MKEIAILFVLATIGAFFCITLYGAFLLIRNIILINKGVRAAAVIYIRQLSVHTIRYIKFRVNDQWIDIPYKGWSPYESEPDSRNTTILYYPNRPKLLVEDTPRCLYLLPAILLLLSLTSLAVAFKANNNMVPPQTTTRRFLRRPQPGLPNTNLASSHPTSQRFA